MNRNHDLTTAAQELRDMGEAAEAAGQPSNEFFAAAEALEDVLDLRIRFAVDNVPPFGTNESWD